jgi:leucyl aminopeptidase
LGSSFCAKIWLFCSYHRPTCFEKDGFEALLAVGQGSEHDPAMIVVEYRFPLPQKTIGLVGKG